MNLQEVILYARGELKCFSDTSNVDADVLVKKILKMSNEDLILKSDMEIEETKIDELKELIERRKKREPVAYLINQKEFFGLNFYVDENVLVPRPDTELLVEEVLKLKYESDNFLFIDVGTGSGAIPIALAKNLVFGDFIALDISEEALNVARRNIQKFNLENRIKLQKSNLLNDLECSEQDLKRKIIITANLPYVPTGDKLMSDVYDFEPHLALFSGEDGLDHYRILLEQVVKIKPLSIFLEIDPRQVEELTRLSQVLLPEYSIKVKKDLAGLERVFCLIKK